MKSQRSEQLFKLSFGLSTIALAAAFLYLVLLHLLPDSLLGGKVEQTQTLLRTLRHSWTRPMVTNALASAGLAAVAALAHTFSSADKQKRFIRPLSIVVLLSSFAGYAWLKRTTTQAHFLADTQSAGAKQLMISGWLPSDLPQDAHSLELVFDIDSNVVCGTFESEQPWLRRTSKLVGSRRFHQLCGKLRRWNEVALPDSSIIRDWDGADWIYEIRKDRLHGYYRDLSLTEDFYGDFNVIDR
jgi:hypothetical protein